MKKVIVVTGANGFIGSNLLEKAAQNGFEAVGMVREGSDVSFLDRSKIQIKRVDYSSYKKLKSSLEGIGKEIHYFIHCAGVTESINPEGFETGNVKVTENLLKTLETSNVKIGKFILLSSLAARGPFSGNEVDHPISEYGRSKLKSEKLVQESGLPYLIVRPTAVYGPRDKAFLELAKLIKNRVQIVLGNPDSKLSFIHVEDLIGLILSADKISEKMVYGYDGRIYSQKDVNNAFKAAMNIRRTITIPIPSDFFVKLSTVMNATTLSLLGRSWKYTPEKALELTAEDWSVDQRIKSYTFQPRYRLEEGVKNTIDWYRTEKWV